MTVRCKSLFASDEGTITKDGKSDRSELTLLVTGTASRSAAHSAVLLAVPQTNPTDNCDLQSVALERIGKLAWIARCEYGVTEPLEVGEWSVSFDTAGATAHMQCGYATRAYDAFGAMAKPPDGDLILVDVDGRAAGVDVPAPQLKFTITYRQPKGIITLGYVKTLRGLVGKVNLQTFAGFDPYEVMFLGASGKQGSKTDPSIDYFFLASENVTNLELAGIAIALKRGHEFLHPVTNIVISADGKRQESQPWAFKVSEIAKPKSFTGLALTNLT